MAAEFHSTTRRVSSISAETESKDTLLNLDDEVVKEALKSAVDLREYSKKIDEELKTVEHDAVQDYIKEAENIASLHHQIRACDNILQKMEEMLGGFQSDLGSISSEIQNLQEQSVQMNVKLKNRQALRGELSQFIDELVIPESMLKTILDVSASDRQFLEQLHELQHKITFAKEQSFRDAKACEDVEKNLEKLKIKAIEKIREFLLQKIYQFRKPLSNYQIPQNAMLKFRFYYEFLLANERQIAKEIRDEYIDTMSKIFWSFFKTYAGRLMRLQMDDVATKEDVLGAEDVSRGMATLFSTKPNVRNRATVFTVGQRNSVLNADLEGAIIVTHAAEEKNEKFQFEALFRSLNYALLDNACREYLFLCDFFMVSGTNATDLFNQVFGKSLKILHKTVETYVMTSYDCIALILCIHIIYRYQSLMQKRDIRVLDSYWDSLLQLCWPKFEQVFHINLDSVRDVQTEKVGAPDARPHYIVRRYAEFASALAAINQSWPDERLQALLQRLQIDIDGLLNRLFLQIRESKVAGAKERSQRKQQLIFLINNYDLILTTLTQNVTEETSEGLFFQELLQTKTAEYIEELLFPYFGSLMSFVTDCERLIEQGHQESLKRYTDKVANIVRSFSNDWKRSIEQINQEVITSFSSLKQGSNVLQQALTQLIQYYHRFQKVLGHPAFVQCTAARNELVNIHHIMVEVKKYKPAF